MNSINYEDNNRNEKELLKEIINSIKSIIQEMQYQRIIIAMYICCFLLGLLLGEYIKIPYFLILIFCVLALIYCIIKLNIKNIQQTLRGIWDLSESKKKYIKTC